MTEAKNIIEELKKDKRFSKRDIRLASEVPDVNVLPTGIPELDSVVLGLGGLPKGKIITLWGPYMCGKSTMVGQIVANMQKNNLGTYGNTAAVLDSEGKFDPNWWKLWGVDLSKVVVLDAICGEDAFDQIMMLFGKVDIVVLDSIATLASKEKVTRGDGKIRMGAEARMQTEKLKDVKNGTYVKNAKGQITSVRTPKLGDTETVFIVINQVRDNIGVMYGKKDTMPGGKINKHLQSLLIRMDVVGYAKERDAFGGITRQKVRLRCERNHYAPPMRECDVWLNVEDMHFEMVDASFILNYAIDQEVVTRKGSWIYHESLPKGKIRGNVEFLKFLNTDAGEAIKSQLGDLTIPEVVIEEEPIIIEDFGEDEDEDEMIFKSNVEMGGGKSDKVGDT